MQVRRADAAQSSELASYSAAGGEQQPYSIATAAGAAWTVREFVGNLAMLSVVRNRAAVMKDYIKNSNPRPASVATPQRERDWADPAAQPFVRRRRELSLGPTVTCCASKEHRDRVSTPMELAARSARNMHTSRAVREPVAPLPFELLSASRPVPELPAELKGAITSYYLSRLRQLSVAHQVRIVHAIALKKDRKTVIKCLKQQERAFAQAAQPAAPLPSSITGRSVKGRPQTGAAHPVPKNVPRPTLNEKSRRRVIREYGASPWRLQGANAAESQAMDRFCQHFAVEACAAFLEKAMDVCMARRTRFYLEQPPIARQLGVVLPEEQLTPLYVMAVDDLLYNMTGWTQREARKFSRAVVAIVCRGIPTVVSSATAEKAAAVHERPHTTLAGIPFALEPSPSPSTHSPLADSHPTTAATATAGLKDMNKQRAGRLLGAPLWVPAEGTR
ncbi:conserved hypothetical protein [Leishmania infantum JPCM5]|uniref:Uncharacterized protein n=2 Tax=Leishmania infantum TaxID=5671 RepID=A4HXD9_LEIIN|nr:conserved hypothetical protein [Leishmania infantum JPCM5]CAC9477982.1 hypothetical_protein_-_conserved [Leishmania infantum]CAM59758.1 conserved hypothetical protein [Leishmania infantum JPCM5]SUZ40833.1 hypothetical_protein_-_conserved [Leishmania infantum]|eukprot:XP_001464730.1 conserved hypothetical protein [Leishmania infantum JPCM5]